MVSINPVSASREGDRYHHVWAARRALELIRPNSQLTRVAVEGAAEPTHYDPNADLAIDLALYWRDPNCTERELEELIQYKHSLRSPLPPLTASDIVRTVEGFASRFKVHSANNGDIRFRIITNRPCAESLRSAINSLAAASTPDGGVDRTTECLSSAASCLNEGARRKFFDCFEVDDSRGGSLDVELAFQREAVSLTLPGKRTREIQLALISLIDRKVRTLGTSTNVIYADDVLSVIGVDRCADLFPAPDSHVRAEHSINRTCAREIGARIHNAHRPFVIHSAGGMGKSELLRQIAGHLPEGSEVVVFDGFGGGRYRDPDDHRHKPGRGALQIINEMAFKGLCDLVLPDPQAPDCDWMRHLNRSLEDGVARLGTIHPDALLILGLDAADNSCDLALQASEEGVVRQILNLPCPEGVRIVATARTERLGLLGDVPSFETWEVPAFTNVETKLLVEAVFPDAHESYIWHFCARTGGNPRVQMFALRMAATQDDPSLVWQVLEGQPPRDPQSAMDRLFSRIIENASRRNGDHARVARMLGAIALLPHPIPAPDLAAAATTTPDEVHSLLADLQGMIAIDGNGVIIRDEPSETYIRTQYVPDALSKREIAARLNARLGESFYAHIAVPRLLADTGQIFELTRLALESNPRPTWVGSDRTWRRARLGRCRFALGQTLEMSDWASSAQIGALAAILAAEEREAISFVVDSPEFITVCASPKLIIDHVLRDFRPTWRGSRYAVLAALEALSGDIAEASAWLRRADAEIRAWYERDPEDRDESGPRLEDCASIAAAIAACSGPDRFLGWIESWQPAMWRYRLARTSVWCVARSDQQLLQQILAAECADAAVLLGVIGSAVRTRSPIDVSVLDKFTGLPRDSIDELLQRQDGYDFQESRLRDQARLDGVAAAECALGQRPDLSKKFLGIFANDARAIHTFQLPLWIDSKQEIVVRSIVLQARLEGRKASLIDIVPATVLEAYEKRADAERYHDLPSWLEGDRHGADPMRFRETMRPILAMYNARASALAGKADDDQFAEELDIEKDTQNNVAWEFRKVCAMERFLCALDVASAPIAWPLMFAIEMRARLLSARQGPLNVAAAGMTLMLGSQKHGTCVQRTTNMVIPVFWRATWQQLRGRSRSENELPISKHCVLPTSLRHPLFGLKSISARGLRMDAVLRPFTLLPPSRASVAGVTGTQPTWITPWYRR